MRVPSVLRQFLQALAAFARAVARALEAAAGAQRPAGRSTAMEALSERFPGAPEHWLRVIAERAPHLAEAIVTEQAVAPEPIRPPTRLRLAWPRRRPAAPRPPVAPSEPTDGVQPALAAWPAPGTTDRPRPVFGAPPPAPERAVAPETPPPRKHARPQLRLVPQDPDRSDPTRAATPDPPRQARRAPTAAGAPMTGLHSATTTPAVSRPALSPASCAPAPAPDAHWSDRDGGPSAGTWTAPPQHALRGPGAWSAGAARSNPVRPLFTDEPAPASAPDPWEPLGGQPHDRPGLHSYERRPITERATFAGRDDLRWPALPPAEEDEAAEGPPAAVERHIREQEFGGWSG